MPRKFVDRVCAICHQSFQGDPRATACFDPACRKARQKQFQQAADAKRKSVADTKRVSAHRRGVVPVVVKTATLTPAARHDLPRANHAICKAVVLGLSSAPAQKLGVFYVVDFGGTEGYKPFIPRRDNEYRSSFAQKIVLIARLNPRGKWDIRPTAKEAACA